MADLMHQASDDQVAMAICLAAVAVCGLLMHFSHQFGRLSGHIRQHEPVEQSALLVQSERLPQSHTRENAA